MLARFAAFLGLAAIAWGARVQSKLVRSKQQVLVQSSSGQELHLACVDGLICNSSEVLEELQDFTPRQVGYGLLEGLAGFDFTEPIGPQVEGLIIDTLVGAASTLLTAIHPLLGIVFSVFTGLFGGGEDIFKDIIESILETVATMIKSSEAYQQLDNIQTSIESAKNIIGRAHTRSQFGMLPGVFHTDVVQVFTDECWNSDQQQVGGDCHAWRTGTTGGTSLVYESEYVQLMIATCLTVGNFSFNMHALAQDAYQAAALAYYHWLAFKSVRVDSANRPKGLVRRYGDDRVTCDFNSAIRWAACWAHGTKDNLMNKTVCDTGEVNYWIEGSNRRRQRSSLPIVRARLESEYEICANEYEQAIISNLAEVEEHVKADTKAAAALARASRFLEMDPFSQRACGPDIVDGPSSKETLTMCGVACSNHPDCNYFSFGEGTCWLHSACDSPTTNDAIGYYLTEACVSENHLDECLRDLPWTKHHNGCMGYARGLQAGTYGCDKCGNLARSYHPCSIAECDDMCEDLYQDTGAISQCKEGCAFFTKHYKSQP